MIEGMPIPGWLDWLADLFEPPVAQQVIDWRPEWDKYRQPAFAEPAPDTSGFRPDHLQLEND